MSKAVVHGSSDPTLSEAGREMTKNRHPCQMMISNETIARNW